LDAAGGYFSDEITACIRKHNGNAEITTEDEKNLLYLSNRRKTGTNNIQAKLPNKKLIDGWSNELAAKDQLIKAMQAKIENLKQVNTVYLTKILALEDRTA
jgi:uncharacterized protein YaaW (UPF0174 family)